MLKKTLKTLIILLTLGAFSYGAYWYLYIKDTNTEDGVIENESAQGGFTPFNRNALPTKNTAVENGENQSTEEEIVTDIEKEIPKLRQLSLEPVSGISASSTKDTTVFRFIDRGTGHIYEADSLSSQINKISNTTLPKTYESYWNKNLTAFVTRYLKDDGDDITNFYAELRSTGTSTAVTPFEIKGRYLSTDIDQITVSPNKDKIFAWNIDNDRGVGYISAFDEKSRVKIYDTPMTQVIIDWPETNNISITTKASAVANGYTYIIDTKTGIMKKIFGGVRGLSAKVSRDLSTVIYSGSKINGFGTSLFNIKNSISQEMPLKTLVDKCVWSSIRKNEVYCAVPTEIPDGIYPDDWYKGNVLFIDKIWHLDTATGEVHLLADLLNLSDKLIDATDLALDEKENFLYFINKRDLTAWSLDLSR